MNGIRNRVLLQEADVVVIKFGDNQYRQWNAAFDAGFAVAIGKPIILLHPPSMGHALKEVNAVAAAVAENPEQVGTECI